MTRNLRTGLATLALTGALVGGGAAVAHAASGHPTRANARSATSTQRATSSSGSDDSDPNCPNHSNANPTPSTS
jgi:hypothetical protein